MAHVLLGGVGYRWMRDASFGVIASDALAREIWPAGIGVADLGYGALYAALDILHEQLPYDRLILLAATCRNREAGRLYRTRWSPPPSDDADVQARIRESGAGVIDLDHLLIIAHYLRALPSEVICIELEPIDVFGGDGLSDRAASCLADALALARADALAPFATDHRDVVRV